MSRDYHLPNLMEEPPSQWPVEPNEIREAVLIERERCAQVVENSETISDQQWFKDTMAGIAAIIRARR